MLTERTQRTHPPRAKNRVGRSGRRILDSTCAHRLTERTQLPKSATAVRERERRVSLQLRLDPQHGVERVFVKEAQVRSRAAVEDVGGAVAVEELVVAVPALEQVRAGAAVHGVVVAAAV